MEPLYMITFMKVCIVLNLIMAFIACSKNSFKFAKFLSVLTVIDIAVILVLKYYI
jgi:hypothetical protein